MPAFIYRSGTTFYLLNELPEDGDYVHASYEAQHKDFFGNVADDPCPQGGSYTAAGVPGLFAKVG